MRQVGDTLVWLALIVVVAAVVYFTPRVASYVSTREDASLTGRRRRGLAHRRRRGRGARRGYPLIGATATRPGLGSRAVPGRRPPIGSIRIGAGFERLDLTRPVRDAARLHRVGSAGPERHPTRLRSISP